MRRARRQRWTPTLAVLLILWAQDAFAHVQVGEATGFLIGFLHPISGLDHVLAMERSFHVLDMRWAPWVQALPGYTVGTLGAFWTVQRLVVLFEVVR